MTRKDARNRARFEEVEAGDEIPSIEVTPSSVQLFLFSAATWNPHRIHYDAPYAASEKYPGLVIHGPFQGGLLSRLVTDWMGEAGVLRRLEYSHRGIAFLGDRLICRGKVAKKYEVDGVPTIDLSLSIETQSGEVTTPGRATVAFPPA
jgi:hydroxyacyl-ACP dehydratase HTD2-like protein with hotdog domain